MDIVNTSELAKQIYPFVIASVASGLTHDAIKAIIERALEFVGIENRIKPPHNVAIPAIQGIAFNSDNEILQNMFYALLTKSMDETQQNSVHPAFPQILGQLSVDDIKILYIVNKDNGTYHYKLKKEFDITEITNSNFLKSLLELFKSRISYLSKLGTLEGSEVTILAHSGRMGSAPHLLKSPITLTPFGKQFMQACLSPEAEKIIQELIDKPR